MTLLAYLVMNVALAIVWMLLTGSTSALGGLVGFVVAFAALTVITPEYGRRVGRTLGYVIWLLGQIVLSGWQVGTAMLTPGRQFTPGIVAVPLRSRTPGELILLASSVTLTPGTISVESGYAPSGERVLFVHSLLLEDPDALRASIRDDMERRILLFTRPREAANTAPGPGSGTGSGPAFGDAPNDEAEGL